jgi:hypothetical protein
MDQEGRVIYGTKLAEILGAHYEKVREQRRSILALLVGLSGGSIALSITFLHDIASARKGLWLIVVAWMLLALGGGAALLSLVALNYRSMRYQQRLEALAAKATGAIVVESEQALWEFIYAGPVSKVHLELPFAEQAAAGLFILGISFLAAFALLSVF